MKRFWLGLALLLLLLGVGLTVSAGMDRIHLGIRDSLRQAQAAAHAEDWPTAQALVDRAYGDWQRYHPITASFADHTPMDELDTLFAELQIFSQQKEMPHFSAVCGHLAEAAASMANNHRLTWWNLL